MKNTEMTSEVKHVALVQASVRCLTFLLPERAPSLTCLLVG